MSLELLIHFKVQGERVRGENKHIQTCELKLVLRRCCGGLSMLYNESVLSSRERRLILQHAQDMT